MLGLKHGTVKLVPYDSEWPNDFSVEATSVRSCLKKADLTIEHVGSTAIPGIAAKPILDMLVPYEALGEVSEFSQLLANLDYELVTDGALYKLFIKGPKEARTHHLTFTSQNSAYWLETIQFRNYLLKHPEIAKEYETKKLELASMYADSRRNYTANKAAFIRRVLRLADKEVENNQQSQSSNYIY